MEEIEVGEYVRTKKGIARRVEDGKFVEIRENGNRMYYVDTNGTPCTWEFSCHIWSKDIVKHSKNIIDLIEVGDIVKTYDVLNNDIIYIWSEDMLKALKEDVENGIGIESIVTKEQFAKMEYKIQN